MQISDKNIYFDFHVNMKNEIRSTEVKVNKAFHLLSILVLSNCPS